MEKDQGRKSQGSQRPEAWRRGWDTTPLTTAVAFRTLLATGWALAPGQCLHLPSPLLSLGH